MSTKKTKDTLFIDMKYIILYRKLGYSEVMSDIFEYQYSDTKITIESEHQRFKFKDEYYPLLSYKDFVTLECVDRLLKIGYPIATLSLNTDGADITINCKDGKVVHIFAAQWGKDYKELVSTFSNSLDGINCLYTSQLSGGLVDYISRIYTDNDVFDYGIFEKSNIPFQFHFSVKGSTAIYDSDFKVENDELLKYLGNSTKVIVPNGITRIGTGAFWNNTTVEEIVLPNTVTCICGDTFIYCNNLKKINIPFAVSEMGDDPFAGCPDIQIQNESNNFIIEDGILFDSAKRFLIHYTASKPEDKYTIPSSVEWIGKHSFYKCQNLKEVVISENVKFMGNNAFSDCNKIHLINKSPYFNYEEGVLYNRDNTQCMHYSMGSGVKTIHLKNTVRTIGRNCFWNCSMIEKIIIPKSVRQIGYNPFASCTNITFDVRCQNYAEKEGILYESTFKEMICCPASAVKNGTIKIPDSVVNIGRNAFTGCTSLHEITIPENVAFISRSSFSNCSNLKKVTIPYSIKEMADWCFNNCINLEEIRLPKNLVIPPNTFNNCPKVRVERY